MRRLERGAGRRRDRRSGPRLPAAGARQFRALAGAAPAGVLTHSTHPGGVGAPPGGTTASCQELADGERTMRLPKARPDAVRKTPQQSAERRAGLRHWPVISGVLGDRPDREAGHGVRRFRTSACRRSAPLIFSQGAENRRGAPAPCQSGRRSVGCLTIESADAREASRSPDTLPWRGRWRASEASGRGGVILRTFTPPRRALRFASTLALRGGSRRSALM